MVLQWGDDDAAGVAIVVVVAATTTVTIVIQLPMELGVVSVGNSNVGCP